MSAQECPSDAAWSRADCTTDREREDPNCSGASVTFIAGNSWQHKNYQCTGYVTGLSGFRRRAPFGLNELINVPIQADEGCMVLDAMSRLSELGDPRFQAALEIHDDLTFIWPIQRAGRSSSM